MAEARLRQEECWCTTQIRFIPISFTWTIKNFSYILKEDGDKLTSSYFSSDRASNNIKWHLIATKRYNQCDGKYHFTLTLCSSLATKNPVFATYALFLLDNENKKCTIVEMKTPVIIYDESVNGPKYSSDILYNKLHDDAEKFLPDDTLKLLCEITFTDSMEMNSGKVSDVKLSNHQLSRDFEELLKNQSVCDVKLVANGETFNAHKAILAARSPVFAAMFSHKMEEDKGEVKIQDVDKEVLREVLYFMYTGKTENLKEMAWDVLPVADKYDLQGLKEECEIILADTISIENAAELLILADFHNVTQLKAKVLDFVRWNSDAVMKTPAWNTLVRNHSDLLNDVITVFSQLTVR